MPIPINVHIFSYKKSSNNHKRDKRHGCFHFGSQIANNFSLVTLQFNKNIYMRRLVTVAAKKLCFVKNERKKGYKKKQKRRK